MKTRSISKHITQRSSGDSSESPANSFQTQTQAHLSPKPNVLSNEDLTIEDEHPISKCNQVTPDERTSKYNQVTPGAFTSKSALKISDDLPIIPSLSDNLTEFTSSNDALSVVYDRYEHTPSKLSRQTSDAWCDKEDPELLSNIISNVNFDNVFNDTEMMQYFSRISLNKENDSITSTTIPLPNLILGFDSGNHVTDSDYDSSQHLKPVNTTSAHVALPSNNSVAACAASINNAPRGTVAAAQAAAPAAASSSPPPPTPPPPPTRRGVLCGVISVANSHPITDRDVLLGRGGLTNSHPGNQSFRSFVEEVKPMYNDFKTKQKKKETSLLVVEHVEEKGGRFLKNIKENLNSHDRWVIAPRGEARRKSSQALREKRKKKNKNE